MRMTDIVVRNLPPPERGQKTYQDDTLSGFGVRVSQGGTKTFTLLVGRTRERVTIGRYPVIGLADARTEAKRLLAEHTLGKHRPHRAKFETALEQFFATHLAQTSRPATQKEVRRLLTRHLLPKLRHESMENITTHDLTRIVDKLVGTPSECEHLFRAAKTFFRWALRRRLISHSPLEGLEAPAKGASRDRVLSDEELARVLSCCTRLGGTFAVFVRLLALTGQRKGEIASLRAEMIDRDACTITLPLTKNGRPHTFPFGAAVGELIEKLPKEGLLFPAKGKDSPLNGFSKAMTQLRKECGIDHWTLHDLRRTFATGLQRLGVRLDVTEALLNHVSGVRAGIVGVYQRHDYQREMRAAIGLWEAHIAKLPTAG